MAQSDGSPRAPRHLAGRSGGGWLLSATAWAVIGSLAACQRLRIHPDEPYASLAPPKAGAFSIEPGKDYVTRFRVVSIDGKPDAALFDALWDDYATPPIVRIE